jgi:hypothetical protein
MALQPALAAMAVAWESAAPSLPRHEPVLPGTPRFVCQAERCPVHCCFRYSVPLGEREVARMRAASGLAPAEFLESENGTPIALPLAQPYLLARQNNRCALLGEDFLCGQYKGRPDACRLYPHQVLFFAAGKLRPVFVEPPAALEAVNALPQAFSTGRLPLLLRNLDCPGFTGAPLDPESWLQLFRETARLQFPLEPGRCPA